MPRAISTFPLFETPTKEKAKEKREEEKETKKKSSLTNSLTTLPKKDPVKHGKKIIFEEIKSPNAEFYDKTIILGVFFNAVPNMNPTNILIQTPYIPPLLNPGKTPSYTPSKNT